MNTYLVREIYDENKQRRIVIAKREEGTFFYEEEYFSTDEFEMCWITKKQLLVGFYDSQETAVREAYANVDWLKVDDLTPKSD